MPRTSFAILGCSLNGSLLDESLWAAVRLIAPELSVIIYGEKQDGKVLLNKLVDHEKLFKNARQVRPVQAEKWVEKVPQQLRHKKYSTE
jgi:hypothetical protein